MIRHTGGDVSFMGHIHSISKAAEHLLRAGYQPSWLVGDKRINFDAVVYHQDGASTKQQQTNDDEQVQQQQQQHIDLIQSIAQSTQNSLHRLPPSFPNAQLALLRHKNNCDGVVSKNIHFIRAREPTWRFDSEDRLVAQRFAALFDKINTNDDNNHNDNNNSNDHSNIINFDRLSECMPDNSWLPSALYHLFKFDFEPRCGENKPNQTFLQQQKLKKHAVRQQQMIRKLPQ